MLSILEKRKYVSASSEYRGMRRLEWWVGQRERRGGDVHIQELSELDLGDTLAGSHRGGPKSVMWYWMVPRGPFKPKLSL